MRLHPVIIVGGGPAGTSCAIALQQLGISDVLLLEAGNYSTFAIGENIPPTSQPLLRELGIFEAFLKEQHLSSYGASSIWGDTRKGFNDTLLSPHGNGWNLDRCAFNKFLARQAHAAGTHVVTEAHFMSTEERNNGHVVSFQHKGKTYSAATPILIDATGKRSLVAKAMGSTQLQDRSLLCIARRFELGTSQPPKSQTYIESAENGWWYAVRLPNNELLIAFYTLPHLVKKQRSHELAYWESNYDQTQLRSEGFDTCFPITSKKNGFHAGSYCLDTCHGANWLAIGDAASAYDPITSRGIVKSLDNGLRAAKAIAAFLNEKADALQQFETTIQHNFRSYQAERAAYYTKEQRWPDTPFWKSMHEICEDANQVASL